MRLCRINHPQTQRQDDDSNKLLNNIILTNCLLLFNPCLSLCLQLDAKANVLLPPHPHTPPTPTSYILTILSWQKITATVRVVWINQSSCQPSRSEEDLFLRLMFCVQEEINRIIQNNTFKCRVNTQKMSLAVKDSFAKRLVPLISLPQQHRRLCGFTNFFVAVFFLESSQFSNRQVSQSAPVRSRLRRQGARSCTGCRWRDKEAGHLTISTCLD